MNTVTSPVARTGLQIVVGNLIAQAVVLFNIDLSSDQTAALTGIAILVVSFVQNLIERKTGTKLLAVEHTAPVSVTAPTDLAISD